MINLTKNQALLLGLFFSNLDRSFYIQEIGRILGKKPGVFQRVLYALEKQGILTSEYRANARYFKAAAGHPLFPELRSVVRKTVGVVGGVRAVVNACGSVELAFLYGSFAKGTENDLSDIDLMIVGEPDESILVKEFDALERSLQREINYRILSAEEFRTRLSDRDPFFLEILRDHVVWLRGDADGIRKMAAGAADQEAGSGLPSDSKPAEKSRKRPAHRRSRPRD